MRGPIAGEFHSDRVFMWEGDPQTPNRMVLGLLRADAREALAHEEREDLLPFVELRIGPPRFDPHWRSIGQAGWYVCDGFPSPEAARLFPGLAQSEGGL